MKHTRCLNVLNGQQNFVGPPLETLLRNLDDGPCRDDGRQCCGDQLEKKVGWLS